MRIDVYTKAVLTVIVVLLALVAFRPYVSPDAVVQAQGTFAGIQYSGPDYSFFDTRTGEVYVYSNGVMYPAAKFRLGKLGQPMVTGQ